MFFSSRPCSASASDLSRQLRQIVPFRFRNPLAESQALRDVRSSRDLVRAFVENVRGRLIRNATIQLNTLSSPTRCGKYPTSRLPQPEIAILFRNLGRSQRLTQIVDLYDRLILRDLGDPHVRSLVWRNSSSEANDDGTRFDQISSVDDVERYPRAGIAIRSPVHASVIYSCFLYRGTIAARQESRYRDSSPSDSHSTINAAESPVFDGFVDLGDSSTDRRVERPEWWHRMRSNEKKRWIHLEWEEFENKISHSVESKADLNSIHKNRLGKDSEGVRILDSDNPEELDSLLSELEDDELSHDGSLESLKIEDDSNSTSPSSTIHPLLSENDSLLLGRIAFHLSERFRKEELWRQVTASTLSEYNSALDESHQENFDKDDPNSQLNTDMLQSMRVQFSYRERLGRCTRERVLFMMLLNKHRKFVESVQLFDECVEQGFHKIPSNAVEAALQAYRGMNNHENAVLLFERVVEQNVLSLTCRSAAAALDSFIRVRGPTSVMSVFQILRTHGIKPNLQIFHSALHLLSIHGHISHAEELLAYLRSHSYLRPDSKTLHEVIFMYAMDAKVSHLTSTCSLETDVSDTLVDEDIVRKTVNMDEINVAELFPSRRNPSISVKNAWDAWRTYVDQASAPSRRAPSPNTPALLIHMLGLYGGLEECVQILSDMRRVHCRWNSLVLFECVVAHERCHQARKLPEFIKFIKRTKHKYACRLDPKSFSRALKACTDAAEEGAAEQVFYEMKMSGIRPSAEDYQALMSMYVKNGNTRAETQCLVLEREMKARGISKTKFIS